MQIHSQLEYQLVTRATAEELKLLIRLKAPASRALTRKPLNLGVVIDRSGSMAGEKLANTKRAIQTLITHLGREDYLSLVQFDDHVDVLLEPTRVTDKDALKQLVERIDAGGSTNLSAGWLKGIHLIERHARPDRVNRCLLLTDGEANVGIQDPAQLATLGRSARQARNIVTTTLGFGEGFNEDLLAGIARASGGAFYFVDQSDQAPAIFNEELQGLLRLAAQNIELKVFPQGPVQVMAQWTDYPSLVYPDGMTLRLGDAYADEEKNVLLALHIPGLPELGPTRVARVELSFAEIGDGVVVQRRIEQFVDVQVADAQDAEARVADVSVREQYALQLAARARRQAIEEADGGDYEKAGRTLLAVAEELSQSALPCPAVKVEADELRGQAAQMDAAHYAHGRKVMQEDVCNLSTGRMDRVASARRRRAAPRRGSGSPTA